MIPINKKQQPYFTIEQSNLVDDLKNIWADLRIWTRIYMLSTVSEFENREAVRNKLYQIPLAFKDKIQTFYGQEFAERFVQLLSKHVILIDQIITAIKQGDQEAADSSIIDIYKNADAIAEALSQINPYWNYSKWKNMLYQYVSYIIDQMIALMSGDYEKDIDIYDRLTVVSREMGRYMAEGVLQRLMTQTKAESAF